MNPQEKRNAAGQAQNPLVVDGQHQACIGSAADNESVCLCQEKDYLIKEEEDALAELRKIKQQATSAKKHFKDLQKGIDSEFLKKGKDLLNPEEKSRYVQQEKLRAELRECEERIEELRSQWKDWDEKRKQATRKKMILLGHIVP